MSVMSAGKKPRALIHPLRAGNSQTRVRGGQFRPAEPGTPAARQEKQRVPGVSLPPPGTAAPAPPRGTRKSPPRPRLWVVPDPPGLAGSAPLVPPPRVAPDDQIPSRPAVPAVAPAPGRPRVPGQTAAPSRARAARPASAPFRVRAAGPASAPSRLPARRVRRTRLTRRGRRLVGPPPCSSWWPCSPQSCSRWLPGPRRPTTVCRRLRSGRPCGTSWSNPGSRCGRSR